MYSYKGDLVLALKFVPPDVTTQRKGKHSKGALHVLVKEARNLMAVCANGTSDPFCKWYVGRRVVWPIDPDSLSQFNCILHVQLSPS